MKTRERRDARQVLPGRSIRQPGPQTPPGSFVPPLLVYRHGFLLVLQSHLVVYCALFLNVTNLFKKPEHLMVTIVTDGSPLIMKYPAFDHTKENQTRGPSLSGNTITSSSLAPPRRA